MDVSVFMDAKSSPADFHRRAADEVRRTSALHRVSSALQPRTRSVGDDADFLMSTTTFAAVG
eukprot:9461914-Pyramimonas_sp.AAC.1